MDISIYSAVMALIWFTLATLIGSVALRRQTSGGGVAFFSCLLALAIVRMFFPLELPGSLLIRSEHIYPALQEWVRSPLVGELSAGTCLLMLWALGCIAALAVLGRKLFLQWRFCRCAQTLESGNRLGRQFEAVCDEYGYRGCCRLAVLQEASVPCQTGFFRPCIILPGNVDSFSAQEVDYMLRHELRHFLELDLWIMLALQILRCVLWWNPVMSVLIRSMEQVLELRCDRHVCRKMSELEQVAYLDTLIRLAEKNNTRLYIVSVQYLGNAAAAELVQRFKLTLQSKQIGKQRLQMLVSFALCLALFVASYGVILQPSSAGPDEEDGYAIAAITPETAEIIHREDGSYELYYEGDYYWEFPESAIETEPFCDLEIIERP